MLQEEKQNYEQRNAEVQEYVSHCLQDVRMEHESLASFSFKVVSGHNFKYYLKHCVILNTT